MTLRNYANKISNKFEIIIGKIMSKKDKNTQGFKYKFIADVPLKAVDKNIKFGHVEIGKSISEIIEKCPSPFTIGLFGKWGSGKTTILNIIENELKNKKIAFTNFDVWKHEGDALRRTFLIETDKELKEKKFLGEKYKIDEKLDKSIVKEFENVTTWSEIFPKIRVIVLIFIMLSLILFRFFPKHLGVFFSTIFSGSLISGILVWYLQNVITKETLTKHYDKFTDPAQFEEEFKQMLENIKTDKILFVIDNLDRCSPRKAVEVLTTVKTFLACEKGDEKFKKCVFLIACDDEAIKKHLENVFNRETSVKDKDKFNADEFLRKFFNTTFKIPRLIYSEIKAYTEYLLSGTGSADLINNSDVVHIITSAFRDNPRQIKQFINILVVNLHIVKHREKNGILIDDTVSRNIPFLTRLLVIQREYPDIYREIEEYEQNENEWNPNGKKDAVRFINETSPYKTGNIRPFLYLRQSDIEKAIPDIQNLSEILIYDNKFENKEIALNIISDINSEKEKITMFNTWIIELLENNKSREIALINIIKNSLLAINHHKMKLPKSFYNKIGRSISYDFSGKISEFKPEIFFKEVLTNCAKEYRDAIIDHYINILNGSESLDFIHLVFPELIKHQEWIKNTQREKIIKSIENNYFDDISVLSLFDSLDDQKKFISEEAITKNIGFINIDHIENMVFFNERIDQLLKFKNITLKNIQDLIKHFTELLGFENEKEIRPQKENFLQSFEKLLNNFSDLIKKLSIDEIINIIDKMNAGVDAAPNNIGKKLYIYSIIKLSDFVSDDLNPSTDQAVKTFWSDSDIENMEYVFSRCSDIEIINVIEKYENEFKNRLIVEQPVFDYVFTLAPKEIKTNWIIYFIEQNQFDRTNVKLEEIDYLGIDKRIICNKLLDKASEIGIAEKSKYYELINKMKCGNSADNKNQLANQIKTLLKTTDIVLQKIGYDAFKDADYLSDSLKQNIIRENIDWLRSLDLPNAKQVHTTQSIYVYTDVLETIESAKNDFIDFVFDKLITRGIDRESIEFGFETLTHFDIIYEKYESLFDYALARIEESSSDDLTTTIEVGLINMMPTKLNRKNREFWTKVDRFNKE